MLQGDFMNEILNTFSLKDYLGAKELTEQLKLTSELSFHWANWDQTCLVQRKHYKNFNNNFHLMKLNQKLLGLKNRPIWLCNKVKVMKSDLYSLYESYLDSRLRLTWFERKDEILFSFESEHGPYYTLTSMKWLENDLYSQFVMKKILLEQYTLRSFRLNASIPVALKLDNDVLEYENSVTIHQLSEFGLIFKIKNKNFLNKIKNAQYLKLNLAIAAYTQLAPLNVEASFKKLNAQFKQGDAKSLTYALESRILNYYGNMNNAKRSTEEEFYLFARYEDLIPVENDVELKSLFPPFIDKTKNYFLKNS